MKLINAEFAIKRLKEQKDKFTVDTIISWLDSISCECEPITWYKVEDELPKEYDTYLVTIEKEFGINIPENRITCIADYSPSAGNFSCYGAVIAWAHLPKPYIA